MQEKQTSEEYLGGLRQKIEVMGPYATQVSTAMIVLGQTVEAALNLRDIKVIKEMKSVCLEIFEQAERALKDEKRNLQ